jgi:hypothetical protein
MNHARYVVDSTSKFLEMGIPVTSLVDETVTVASYRKRDFSGVGYGFSQAVVYSATKHASSAEDHL